MNESMDESTHRSAGIQDDADGLVVAPHGRDVQGRLADDVATVHVHADLDELLQRRHLIEMRRERIRQKWRGEDKIR